WTSDCGLVDADLVGAGVEDLGRVAEGANAAANGEGNKNLPGSAADGINERLAPRGGRGDVEQDDFVGAGLGMSPGQLGGIAGIAQIQKLYAFDYASRVHVQAGDDPLKEHRNSPESADRLHLIFLDETARRKHYRARPRQRTRRHIQ